MPEYGWSRMFLNMLGFLICGSILLNNAWICLNMPETEPEINIQVSFIDTQAYLESYQTAKMV